MSISYLERVFLGDDRGPVSWLIRALLWPLSVAYRIGLAVYLWVYNSGLRKRHKLGVPVISVGNLTCGGTGKTPAVQTICRMLAERGLRVVVLSRGHGGSARGATIASDGESVAGTSAEVGDEPVLLSKTLRGVPVVVGKDRRASGDLACERFSPDVIVLDDGMQYWQLHRDLDIVILNARRPYGSGHVFPMGDLREPISGLRRAGAVLLTNSRALDEAQLDSLKARVSKLIPATHVFASNHVAVGLSSAETGEEHDLSWVAGRRIFAFCGIGSPESFLGMLSNLGAAIAGNIIFPDHYRLSDRDITAIIDGAKASGAEAIITTEKDLARLDQACIPNLHTLAIRLEIEDSSHFAQYIANRIDRQNRPAVA